MFGNVHIKSRPLKFAYLVDVNDSKQVREAIRISSTLWGGEYFPIIPLFQRIPKKWGPIGKSLSARKVVIGYIDAFDPDILINLSKNVPDFIRDLGIKIVDGNEIWSGLEGEKYFSPKYGLGLFELLNDLFETEFKFKRKYPIEVVIPKIPDKHGLFWSSFFGELPENVHKCVKENFSDPLEIEFPICNPGGIKELVSEKKLFPRRITRLHIDHKNMNRSRSGNCVFYMDASKVDDVIDYWNLRAAGRNVLPIPKQFQDSSEFRELVIEFLKESRCHWKHNPSVCDTASLILSRNSTADEMRAFSDSLVIERDPTDPSSDPFFTSQHWYPRMWDEWARDKDFIVPADVYGTDEITMDFPETKSLQFTFKPVLPKFAYDYGYPNSPRCANEVGYGFYGADCNLAEAFPKSSGKKFLRAISGRFSYGDKWRVSRNGLVRFVSDQIPETREFIKSEDLFFAWLDDIGWKAKKSSAGTLAEQIQSRLGGNLGLIKHSKLLEQLEYLNGGSKKEDAAIQERFQHVTVIKENLKKITDYYDLHGKLIEKGVFKLGLDVQCPVCFRHSFIFLEEIGNTCKCSKCLNSFSAIGTVNEGKWCYKTVGPFSVPRHAEGAYSVLLLLHFFSHDRILSGGHTPCLSFEASKGGNKFEADYASFWRDMKFGEMTEGVMFAECKTFNSFKENDFKKMKTIASEFPGAVLVFSTLKEKFSNKEIKMLRSITKSGRKYWKHNRPINPVLMLTGRELFSESKPPYCWEETEKKSIGHVDGVLDLCKATQFIYLGMKSWEIEWQEQLMKKKYRKSLEEKKKKDLQ